MAKKVVKKNRFFFTKIAQYRPLFNHLLSKIPLENNQIMTKSAKKSGQKKGVKKWTKNGQKITLF